MMLRRLLPVLLVLLQSGLAAGRAHHGEPGCAEAPQFHASAILDHLAPEDQDSDEHQDADHDSDAIDLSGVMVSTTPPVLSADAFALAPLCGVATADRFTDATPTPLGLPPATAGPSTPRYITFCTLTI